MPLNDGINQMVQALRDSRIDIAIALTEGLVAALASRATHFKLIGTYTSTPLTWSIATSKTKYASATPEKGPRDDLKNTKIGISRFGSGSHLIPFVLADQQGWLTTGADGKLQKPPFEFVALKDITGLVDGITSGTIDAFLWERFMTKPWYDNGTLHHHSNITPPWPAFLIAASTSLLSSVPSDKLTGLLDIVNTYTSQFVGVDLESGQSVEFVKNHFGQKEEDVKAWFKTVGYPTDAKEVSRGVLEKCLELLKKAGAVQIQGSNEVTPDDMIDGKVAKLVQ
ncbi:hypothetical protein HK097_007951 [Rhizophlyctis rosea]|uniref:Ca3427-like PBP 2 domain-containing protein n=1 Tax=Rhizophlyctis rosea TaxID=64517 RepID=A0AAD5X1B9_9FUNG|nr:hypothetical protein HK097_007951 [Rhizophlyctis rosea]